MSLSNYAEDKIRDHLVGKTAFTMPSVWVALHTGFPGEGGLANEVSGNNYSRDATVGADWAASSGGSSQNANAITFPQASGSWGELKFFTTVDAVSAGNQLEWGVLSTGSPIAAVGKASDDVLTAPGHGLSDTTRVVVLKAAGVAVPAGLSEGTDYFVRDATTDTLKLAATSGGAAIDLTANGALLVIRANFKTVGLNDTPSFAVGQLVLTSE